MHLAGNMQVGIAEFTSGGGYRPTALSYAGWAMD
jgi:hypothetical protein